jgi:hypothetical protein
VDENNGDRALISIAKKESTFEYRVTLVCSGNTLADTFSWKSGDNENKRITLCRGVKARVNVREWEKLFHPLPDNINGRKPEIFVEPDKPKILG